MKRGAQGSLAVKTTGLNAFKAARLRCAPVGKATDDPRPTPQWSVTVWREKRRMDWTSSNEERRLWRNAWTSMSTLLGGPTFLQACSNGLFRAQSMHDLGPVESASKN